MPTLLKFECRVPVEGYRIGTREGLEPNEVVVLGEGEREIFFGHKRASWKRVDRQFLEPKSDKVKCFDLYDETSNPFLDFANAPTSLEGIKALADRFGPLDEGPQFCDFWFVAVKELQSALAIWDDCKAAGNFDPIIREVAMREWSFNSAPTILNQTKLARNSNSELQEAVEQGRKLGALTDATREARRRLNDVEGRESNYDYGLPANIQLGRAPKGENGARLYIRPRTLSDAIWTQLAQAVAGSESLKACVECKKWFTVSSSHGRSDKGYCSNACRMRAYRKRKERK